MGGIISLLIILVPTILFFLIIIWAIIKGIIRGYRKSVILAIQAIIAFLVCMILFIIFSNSERVDSGLVSFINNFLGDGFIQNKMGVSPNSTKLTEILYEFIPKQLNYGDGISLIVKDNGQYLLQLALFIYKLILAFIMVIFYFVLVFIFYLIYLIFYPERRYKKKVNNRYEKAKEEERLEIERIKEEEEKKKEALALIEEDNPDSESLENDEESSIENDEESIIENDSIINIEDDESKPLNDDDTEIIVDKNDITNVLIEQKKVKDIKPYRKRKLLGSLIGGIRGFISAIFFISFVGSILYIVAGLGDYDYTNELEITDSSLNAPYEIYQAIGTYGEHGIFKVLNSIKSKDNMPFYLYAADLVFSGRIEDPKRGLDERFNFANEIGAYMHFGRLTVDLLMKYGKDDLILAANGKKDMLDTIIDIMSIEEFQNEYDAIINEFNGKTYFVNFALSLLDSIIEHLEQLEFAKDNPDMVDMLLVLFKKNYLTDYIPEERAIKEKLIYNPDFEYETRPFITASNLLTRDDTKALLSLVLNSIEAAKIEDSTERILAFSENILPELRRLSILNGDRKNELNGLYERLYVYIDNKYIQSTLANETNDLVKEDSQIKLMSGINTNTLDWTHELNELLKTSSNMIKIVRNVYDKDNEILDNVFEMFSDSNINKLENIKNYDIVLDSLSKSQILDRVMSSSGMVKLIKDSLAIYIPDMYVPKVRYYDIEDGNNILRGETYNVLTGFKALLMDNDAKEGLKALKNDENRSKAIKSLLVSLDNETNEGKPIYDLFLDSRMLRAAVSGILSSYEVSSLEIVVPNKVKELENEEVVNIINKDELKEIIDSIIKIMPDDGKLDVKNILITVFDNKEEFLDSDIICATLINMLVNSNVGINNVIIVPDDYKDDAKKEKLIEYNDSNIWIANNELGKLFDALDYGLNLGKLEIDFNNSEEVKSVIMENIKDLNDEAIEYNGTRLDAIYSSLIMKSTLATKLINASKDLIIPSDAYDFNDTYIEDSINKPIIEQVEVSKIIDATNLLELDLKELNINQITLRKNDIEALSLSKILRASISNKLNNQGLIVPTDESTFENGYINKSEFVNLLNVFDENRNVIFDTEEDKINIANVKLDEEKIKSFLIEDLKDFTNSTILSATIINRISKERESYGIILPNVLLNESSDTYLKENYLNTAWYQIGELDNMLNALNNIFPNTALKDVTSDAIKGKIFDDNFIDNCYISIILNTTISDKLANQLETENREEITVSEKELLSYKYNLNIEFNEIVYKEDSVKNLINALDNLTINNIDDISNADYKKLALDEKTNYDILYKSKLVWDIVSVKIKDTILNNEDIINRDEAYHDYLGLDFINKEELEDIKIVYNSSETEKNLDQFGASDIKLNDNSKDAICNSYILRASITNKINTNNDIVVALDSYEDELLIKNDDLYDFLDIADLLNIDLGNPQINLIELSNENNLVFAKSRIFRSTLYDNINTAPDSVVSNIGLEKNESNNIYFNYDEALLVLNKLNKYKNDFFVVEDNKINIDKFSFDAKKLSVEKALDLIKSDTFYGILVFNINSIDSLVIPSFHSEYILRENIINNFELNPWYLDNELEGILNGAKIFIGSNEPLDNFKDTKIKDEALNLTDDNLTSIYESVILRLTLTSNVDDAILSQGDKSREELRSKIKIEDTNYYDESSEYVYYQKNEIRTTIDAIKQFGFETLNEFENNPVDYKTKITDISINFSVVSLSYLVWDIIYCNLNDTINTNTDIIDHNDSSYLAYGFEFYHVDELNGIRYFLNGCAISNIDEFKMEMVKYNNDVKLGVEESLIIRATITNEILNNDTLIITENIFDLIYIDLISDDEINKFLNGVIVGAKMNLDGFNIDNLNVLNIDSELVSNSIILRASIYDVILENGDIRVIENNYEIINEYNSSNSIIVLNKAEVNNLILGLKAIGMSTFNTVITFDDLVKLNEEKLYLVTSSSILLNASSKVLTNGFTYLGHSLNYDSYRTVNSNCILEKLEKTIEFIEDGINYRMQDKEATCVFDSSLNELINIDIVTNYNVIAFTLDVRSIYNS